MDATQLHTERLMLRPWRDADREPFAALNRDPEVMEHFPAPLTREQIDAFVDRAAAQPPPASCRPSTQQESKARARCRRAVLFPLNYASRPYLRPNIRRSLLRRVYAVCVRRTTSRLNFHRRDKNR